MGASGLRTVANGLLFAVRSLPSEDHAQLFAEDYGELGRSLPSEDIRTTLGGEDYAVRGAFGGRLFVRFTKV